MGKNQDMNTRVTKLSDWLLRIHARKEPMNGYIECVTLLHEQQAYITELENKLMELEDK